MKVIKQYLIVTILITAIVIAAAVIKNNCKVMEHVPQGDNTAQAAPFFFTLYY